MGCLCLFFFTIWLTRLCFCVFCLRLMHFEGQDWREKNAARGINWIEPPKRERKVHYGVNQCVCVCVCVCVKACFCPATSF